MTTPPDQNGSRAPTLMAIIWVTLTISTTLAACRIFTRLRILRAAGKDDVALVVAVIMNVLAQISCTISLTYGTGRHMAALSPQDAREAIMWTFISEPFGIMAWCMPKVAIALLLVRLMGPGHRRKWFLYLLVSVLTTAGIVCGIILFVQCKPVAALWDPTIAATASCWDPSVVKDVGYFIGAYSAFCDFVLAVFPITIIWKLQMPLKRKIGICFLMGLGIFAMVCAIVKTRKTYELDDRQDPTYVVVPLLLWAAVEINVLITCACIPTLGPFLTILRSKDIRSAFQAIARRWSTRDSSDHIALTDRDALGKLNDSAAKCGPRHIEGDLEEGSNTK